MTKEEAIKWLGNLIDDIGQTRGMYLWPYAQALQEIITILSDRNAAQQWISVKDRLPDKPGLYLCAVGASYHPVRVMEYRPVGMYENERYWVSVGAEINGYVYDWFVHAWMPLPEPPKEDRE